MTAFEISSNLTTEEIKEKIRSIGYFRYPILREKRLWVILIIFWSLIGWTIFIDEIRVSNIYTDTLSVIIMTFGVVLPIFLLLISNRNSNKNKEIYSNVIWFLEGVIYSRDIINLKYQKLQLLVSIDTIENDIDPSLVIQIKDTIQEISDIIQSIHWMEWNILENKKYSHIFYNEEEYLYYLDLFISKYKKELFTLFDYFEKSIQDWLTLHTQELETIEMNIYHQSKELSSENLAIQDIRLRGYLENLKNTVNLYIPS